MLMAIEFTIDEKRSPKIHRFHRHFIGFTHLISNPHVTILRRNHDYLLHFTNDAEISFQNSVVNTMIMALVKYELLSTCHAELVRYISEQINYIEQTDENATYTFIGSGLGGFNAVETLKRISPKYLTRIKDVYVYNLSVETDGIDATKVHFREDDINTWLT
jgi:hypothetical protein